MFCSFYIKLSLHAKMYIRRSKGVACGQYKDKEGKKQKKPLKLAIFKISKNKKMRFYSS